MSDFQVISTSSNSNSNTSRSSLESAAYGAGIAIGLTSELKRAFFPSQGVVGKCTDALLSDKESRVTIAGLILGAASALLTILAVFLAAVFCSVALYLSPMIGGGVTLGLVFAMAVGFEIASKIDAKAERMVTLTTQKVTTDAAAQAAALQAEAIAAAANARAKVLRDGLKK